MKKLNINSILKEFTKNFIINSSNIDESDNDNFIKRVINLLKLDTFNILEFEKLLNELRENKVQKVNSITLNKPDIPVNMPSKPENNNSFSPPSNKPDIPVNIPPKKNNLNIPSVPKAPSLKKQKIKFQQVVLIITS